MILCLPLHGRIQLETTRVLLSYMSRDVRVGQDACVGARQLHVRVARYVIQYSGSCASQTATNSLIRSLSSLTHYC